MNPEVNEVSGWFAKDGEYILTSMSKTVGVSLGLPGGFYHRDMSMKDRDIAILAPVCGRLEQEDHKVLKTGKASRSGAAIYLPKTGWGGFTCTKSPDGRGGILGRTVHHSPETLFNGWAAKLDFKNQVLPLGNGRVLTRRELITLHMLLHGWSRKRMSESLYISVKAVEKRLTVIKAKLKTNDTTYDTIQSYLISRGICAMLMTKRDWFITDTIFRIYA